MVLNTYSHREKWRLVKWEMFTLLLLSISCLKIDFLQDFCVANEFIHFLWFRDTCLNTHILPFLTVKTQDISSHESSSHSRGFMQYELCVMALNWHFFTLNRTPSALIRKQCSSRGNEIWNRCVFEREEHGNTATDGNSCRIYFQLSFLTLFFPKTSM